MIDQLVNCTPMNRIFYDPNRNRYGKHPVLRLVFDNRTDSICDRNRLVNLCLREENQELIAKTPPADKITWADRSHQNRSYLADEFIACGITDRVVALQVIPIDQEQAEGL